MITYKQVDKTYFPIYDSIPMLVHVESEYAIEKIDNGLGGFRFVEKAVAPYIKDFGKYERATEYEKLFDITNWAFFMAYDGEHPIGAITIAGETPGMNMLYGRDDACVLWDIRVADGYKHMGVGQKLLDLGVDWGKSKDYKQMIIECQNNNVPAVRFYHKQGAVLVKVDEYAYYMEEDIRGEAQLVWHLDL